VRPGILIVDDSLTVRMHLDEAFRSAGFTTTLCGTVAAARAAVTAGGFALVVLDVLLPDADGVEFLAELKATPRTAGIPVMLLSTESEVRDRIRGLKTGADEYVGKPYDSAFVISRAEELIRGVQPAEELSSAPRILIIDDSPTFRSVLESALETRGYLVTSAGSGEEGLRLAVGTRPRAVMVDGLLPGIDGKTVIRRLRQDATLRRIPCVLITGSEETDSELQALDAGADAYVRKEENMEIILTKLAAVLRSSDATLSFEAPASLLGPKRILAVDDSMTYLQVLAEQLRQEGYEPILARSGEEALDLLAVQPVDCVLLDVLMPGLSGHDTCRRIKSSPGWRDIPVVMLTAREEREAMIEGINSGADDYIPKSSEFDVLKARLRAQLRRKQFEDENRQIRERLLQKELEAARACAAQQLADTRERLLKDLEKKNRELEAFSYSISHDLRSPLRAIDGFSKILLKEQAGNLDEEGKRVLGIVVESTRRMGQLIDDLLQFSRLGRIGMRISRVDMTALVQSVLSEVVSSRSDRKLETVLAPLPATPGDTNLLRQVLVNLIGNAVKYSLPKEAARIEIGGHLEGSEALYFVRDNGVGFKMEYAHKLFGVFQRLHSSEEFEGTGVGLALVQRIIERHGGRVWAESTLGQGSTFYFTLPQEMESHESP
jgi:DNA-binding response OmpR family regulator